MNNLAFTPAIDIPLTCVTLLAFLYHFNSWARQPHAHSNVDFEARLPTARFRVISLFVGLLCVCWLANFPVWFVFALLLGVGIVVALLFGDVGTTSGFMLFVVAFIIREWSFGFPLAILHPAHKDSHPTFGETYQELLGVQGRVVAPLRPCGQAELNGRVTSVVSESGELLDIGTPIIVSQVTKDRICVRPDLPSQ